MKSLKKLALCSLLVAGFLFAPSCSKDEDEPYDPNKPENVDPSQAVSDPVGTVTMRMRNDNETKLGDMIVSPENNFSCKTGMIASLGPVAGLGNITDIPLSGWSDNVAVIIGNGYVYYDGNQYYRIYAVQWLKEAGTPDAILGVELKYQSPFKGVDEELIPETYTLSFSDEGSTDEIRFQNTSVIPFKVSSDQPEWCKVNRWASQEKNESFLYDGISVTVTPNEEMEETRAKITLQTLYGKRTIINVTRSGQAPSILFPNGEREYTREDVSANGKTYTIELSTNVKDEDFKAEPNVDWIVVDEISQSEESRAMANKIMRYTVHPNYTSESREGKITLSSTKGEKTSVLTISQQAGEMTHPDPVTVETSIPETTINFTTNVSGTYKISSSAGWCNVLKETVEVDTDYNKTISVSLELEPNISETDRKAVITVTILNGTLKTEAEVIQKGLSFENIPNTVYFSKTRQFTTLQLPIAGLKVKSTETWCQPIIKGSTLSIRVDETSEDRTAVISFENTSAKITVDQSKYAVGDEYNEKGVVGIVLKMDGATRLVRSERLGSTAYSTENYVIGATDFDNGMVNTNKVKTLSNWQKYYPAFALCDALNVDGVTGWYLPAFREASDLPSAWTSTENTADQAFYTGDRWDNTASKSSIKDVYAIHQFIK